MNLVQLDILAKSIRKKGKEVNEETLELESLFFPYGTINKKEANELLWAKREQIQLKVNKKYRNTQGFALCPASLAFNSWSNYGKIRK